MRSSFALAALSAVALAPLALAQDMEETRGFYAGGGIGQRNAQLVGSVRAFGGLSGPPATAAKAAPLGNEVPLTIKFFEAMVPRIRDIHVTMTIDGDSPWGTQLSGFLCQWTAGVAGL